MQLLITLGYSPRSRRQLIGFSLDGKEGASSCSGEWHYCHSGYHAVGNIPGAQARFGFGQDVPAPASAPAPAPAPCIPESSVH